MKQFSIIIPTMKKVWPVTVKLLENLYNDPAVGEIILIDNSEQFEPYDLPFGNNKWIDKIKPVQMDKNMYVNPSWNWGVNKAKYDYLGILNDDILIPQNIFSAIATGPIDDLGILGAYEPMVSEIDTLEQFYIDKINFAPSNQRWNAFGIFMVMVKKNYRAIDDRMKIYCGDDSIFHRLRIEGKMNGMLMFPIKTKMSATSSDPEFDAIKVNDELLYKEIQKQYGF